MNTYSPTLMKAVVIQHTTVLALAVLSAQAATAASSLWQRTMAPTEQSALVRAVPATQSLWVELDQPSMSSQMRPLTHPTVRPSSAKPAPVALEIPMPDGGAVSVQLRETQVMAPGLAARYPEIKTFEGTAAGRRDISAQIVWSPTGLRAQVFTPQGRAFIDPVGGATGRLHQVTWARNHAAVGQDPDHVLPVPKEVTRPRRSVLAAAKPAANASISSELRTYRLAIATTGEYARKTDPLVRPDNKSKVLTELVTFTQRLSGIFEREVGIRFQLADNNDAIIYTDPNSDPYTNSDINSLVDENTANLPSVLGNSAFDIGHVLGTTGGGLAYLGSACSSVKAGGATGTSFWTSAADDNYLRYMAHELGHQLGAEHTFNSASSNCGAYNASSSAYEPGSGSTLMSYAGVCGSDNIENRTDTYFHSHSFEQIVTFTRGGGGATCGQVSRTNNHAPRVFVPAGGFTIPMRTPFELTGRAIDEDGDSLSYQWEQHDLGPQGYVNGPSGNAPLFRSFPPTYSPTRVFPQVGDLIANKQSRGEILPSYARGLSFRFTARDNRVAPSSGGVSSADLSFNVTADAGPFRVSSPNTPASYRSKGLVNVTWDVARTNQPPVSCPSVDISLSIDQGNQFTKMLATAVPNSGFATVRLPALTSRSARIKVKCRNSIFFDISDADFLIQ